MVQTDDDDLFRDSLSYFPAAGFEITWQTFDLHKTSRTGICAPSTRGMFSEQGIPIKALIVRKGPDSADPGGAELLPNSRRAKMPPSEFVVKTVYWFFLYGCIGWGRGRFTPPSKSTSSSTAGSSAGRSSNT